MNLGDRVRRKPEHQGHKNWRAGDKVLTVKNVTSSYNKILVSFEEATGIWYADKFDIVGGPGDRRKLLLTEVKA